MYCHQKWAPHRFFLLFVWYGRLCNHHEEVLFSFVSIVTTATQFLHSRLYHSFENDVISTRDDFVSERRHTRATSATEETAFISAGLSFFLSLGDPFTIATFWPTAAFVSEEGGGRGKGGWLAHKILAVAILLHNLHYLRTTNFLSAEWSDVAHELLLRPPFVLTILSALFSAIVELVQVVARLGERSHSSSSYALVVVDCWLLNWCLVMNEGR